MRIGAPLAHANHAARGPPWRSIATSKRLAAKPSRHGQVVAHAGEAGPLRNDDDLVQERVAGDHRGG